MDKVVMIATPAAIGWAEISAEQIPEVPFGIEISPMNSLPIIVVAVMEGRIGEV
jgi:hypothetical protein